MQQFKDLLLAIMAGAPKDDRTGVGTVSIFGHQMRFDLSKGFPLVTLKRTYIRAIVHELLWFFKGSTQNEDLRANNVSIWDEWAVPENIYEDVKLRDQERLELYAQHLGVTVQTAGQSLVTSYNAARDESLAYSAEACIGHGNKVMDEAGIPSTRSVLRVAKGELGPIYGKQWRSWPSHRGGTIDQLQWAIDRLKTNPTCRRIIVSAWNPADLPQNGVSPSDNAAQGYMALAACHTMFQFYASALETTERYGLLRQAMQSTETITVTDRIEELFGDLTVRGKVISAIQGFKTTGRLQIDAGEEYEVAGYGLTELTNALMIVYDIPKYKLSCQLYQRSADTVLGVPFNIASYALLTHMVAQVVNMVPGDFIHTFGDAHIYKNHFKKFNPDLPHGGVEELVEREPVAMLPQLVLNPKIKNIDDFTFDDIEVVDYTYHPKMDFPIAV